MEFPELWLVYTKPLVLIWLSRYYPTFCWFQLLDDYPEAY